MYNAFDRPTVEASARRFDSRLRHKIAENIRPRSLVTFPCPYIAHGVRVQRGGPSPTPATPRSLVRFATSNRGSSVSARKRYAATMRRRRPH